MLQQKTNTAKKREKVSDPEGPIRKFYHILKGVYFKNERDFKNMLELSLSWRHHLIKTGGGTVKIRVSVPTVALRPILQMRKLSQRGRGICPGSHSVILSAL